jgi:hypothetical protein
MTRTEERLAEALNAAANTVRPGTLRPLTAPDTERLRRADRPGKRRRAWLVPVAAAAAITAVALASVAIVRQAAGRPSAPAGPPPYYVLVRSFGWSNGLRSDFVIEARSTATGRVISTLKLPERLGAREPVRVAELSAAADRHTFFVALNGQAPSAEICRFHVTATGHITRLTRVPGFPEAGFAMTAMAASPDGGRLAIGGVLTRSYRRRLMIVNVASGKRTAWTGGLPSAAPAGQIGQLSWTADGHTLAFVMNNEDVTQARSFPYFDAMVQTVDARGKGGSLVDSRTVFAQKASPTRDLLSAVISPDGRQVDVIALAGARVRGTVPEYVQVIEVGVTHEASHPRLLYVGKAGAHDRAAGGAIGTPVMATDGHGHLLLVTDEIGWLDHGRLHPLAPGVDVSPAGFAW